MKGRIYRPGRILLSAVITLATTKSIYSSFLKMSDDTATDPQQPVDTGSTDESFPDIPSNPEPDNAPEGFGIAPSMQMLTPIAGGTKVDPRTLKGAFFFMDVFPFKRSDAKGQPSSMGSFNAIAYDPLFTGKETTAQIEARYKDNPPYIETLTDPDQNDGNMADIKGTRATISKYRATFFGCQQIPLPCQ